MRVYLYVLIFFFSCAGTTGRIKFYNFSTSKNELEKSLLEVINKDSVYRVPFKWKDEAVTYDFLERRYIYFSNSPEEMYEVGFSGDSTEWKTSLTCKLALIGVFNGKQWKFKKDLSTVEMDRLENRFETEILSKIKYDFSKSD